MSVLKKIVYNLEMVVVNKNNTFLTSKYICHKINILKIKYYK